MSEDESQNAATSPTSTPATCSQNELETASDDTSVSQELKGWLNKRTKISHKWKKQFCVLKKSELQYGDAEVQNGHLKKIPLDGAEVSEADIDKKQFAFRIRPLNTKRYYYFHCENEDSRIQWMQAIYFAKAASNHGDASQACVVQ